MVGKVEACVLELPGERVVGIGILPRADQAGETVQCFLVERKYLADFACRGFSAISDHVGGHCRAKFSVAFIYVLNSALALVAAGQIQIDVRPFSSLFGKKTFEKQIHPNGIDRSNSK